MGPGPGLAVALAAMHQPSYAESVKAHLATIPPGKFALVGCLTTGSRMSYNPANHTHVFETEAAAHAWWKERYAHPKGYRVYHRDANGTITQVFGEPLD